jgi:hypothetical protein
MLLLSHSVVSLVDSNHCFLFVWTIENYIILCMALSNVTSVNFLQGDAGALLLLHSLMHATTG